MECSMKRLTVNVYVVPMRSGVRIALAVSCTIVFIIGSVNTLYETP